MPEDKIQCETSADTAKISAGNTEVLSVEGIADDSVVSAVRVDGHTVSVNIERKVKQSEDNTAGGDLAPLDLVVSLNGSGIKADTEALEKAGSGGAALDISCVVTSIAAAGEEDRQTVSSSLPVKAENDILIGPDPAAKNSNSRRLTEAQLTGSGYESVEPVDVYWMDNNNEENKRPGYTAGSDIPPFEPELCFTYTDKYGNPLSGAEAVKLTEENMAQFGIDQLPEISVSVPGSGRYTVQVEGELPTVITYTDEYGDMVSGYPKYVSWSLEAPDVDGYSFRDINDDNRDDYPSAQNTGWYYLLYDNYSITFTLHSGSFTPDHDALEQAVLNDFGLNIITGGTDENKLGFAALAEQGRFVISESEDGNSGTITIRDLWRYNFDGSRIIYNVEAQNNIITAEGMEEGDQYSVIYDNALVPNYGSVTDKVYSGGTVYLTLSGTTDYEATKKWLDPEGSKRPTGEIQLWRYTEGAGYNTAAPVRDQNGNILIIELNGQDEQELKFPAENITVEGVMGALPKYDIEGNRYVYAVREYLNGETAEGEDADNYEQVFGNVEDASGTVTDTLPEGTAERAAGNTFVYDGGVLSNRINDTVKTTAVKTWQASAFQSELSDVKIEMKLQYRAAGTEEPWQDVTDTDGEVTVVTMDEFMAEALTGTEDMDVPKYGPLGRELEYRWIESAVYQGDSDNLLTDGGLFNLVHTGREITYKSTSEYSEDGLETYITNNIVNTIDYDIIKVWRDENGEKIEAPEGAEVTFVIYQTLSGEELTEDKIVAEVVMDGVPDDEATELPGGLTFMETEPWKGKVDLLPEFDRTGARYEYTLLESGIFENYFPVYETTRSEEDFGYDTTVINQPGEGNRILVRKDWVDNSDSEHRGDVKIEVYNRRTNAKVGEVTLGDNIWTDWVGIGALEPEDVYILETSVTTDKEYDTNASKLSAGDPTPESHIYETDNHRYEATYSEAVQIQNDVMYQVANRRLGNIDVTVIKTWLDGDGSIREELQKKLSELPEESRITPALRLEFTEEDANDEGYEITYTHVNEADYVTLGSSDVAIEDKDEKPVSSVQKIDLDQDSSEYYFFGLPKYDTAGDIAHYTAREVWVLEENSTVVYTLSDLASSENESYRQIYELVKEYETVYGETKYEVSELHDRDTQSLEIVNRLAGDKDLSWYKEWNDAYNVQNNLRPDIYLDVYRVGHTDPDDPNRTVTELYLENYRWHAPEDEGQTYDWEAVISNAPKYDPLGYEYRYYAVEQTQVEDSAFDYLDTVYKDGETYLGTEYDPEREAVSDKKVIAVSSDSNHYALQETGTFVNNIHKSVTINGYKLWTDLPAGYEMKNLPGVRFSLMQSTDVSDPEEVATLTVSDWNAVSSNGRYSIGFEYYGENHIQISDGQTVVTGEKDAARLEKYDEDGYLYNYTIEEKILWPSEDEPYEEGGEHVVFNIDPVTNTYQIVNGYLGVKGQIDVKKLLCLPMDGNEPAAYPAVTFRVSRTFIENDGNVSDKEIVTSKVISSAAVRTAYGEQAPDNGVVELALTFEDMPKYAPNGSEYVYTVEEIKKNLNGYDTWAAAGDVLWDDISTDENLGTDVGNITAERDNKVDATFANAQPEDKEKVTISGQKKWTDYDDVFGLRPDKDEFTNSLTLYRSAQSQPGQNNPIAETEVPAGSYKITVEAGETSPWQYKIEGTEDSGELERYAPNGMPWKYVVREDTANTVYTVSPSSAGQSGSTAQDGNVTVTAINNSIQTSAAYRKNWVNTEGEPVTEDYLGTDLTVSFKLQVAEKNDDGTLGQWQDAETYFEDNLTEDVIKKVFGSKSFTAELKGRVDSDIWSKGGSFTALPRVIVKDGGQEITNLSYRTVESSISYGEVTQTVTVSSTAGNKGYTYTYSGGLFSSGKDSYVNSDNTAVNKIETVDMTVTKEWHGDNGNAYGSRPDTGRTNYTWEITFVIQRSTDDKTWENVPVYTGENSSEDLTVTLYGTDDDDSLGAVIEDLPKTDLNGNPYSYRARELQPDHGISDGKVNESDIVYSGIFHDTYAASYYDKGFATTAVNSLQTTEVYAQKNWIGEDRTGVMFKLQYLADDGGDGKWTDLVSVRVDGTKDEDPSEPYYEYDQWKAVWKDLPEVLAGSLTDEDGNTQYRVTETLPSGYMQTESSVGDKYGCSEYFFTNIKTVNLTVNKRWNTTDHYTLPADGIKVGIFRTTADSIPESDHVPVTDSDGDPVTAVLKASGWTGTFKDLPKYDEKGNPYIYYARELDSDGNPYEQNDRTDELLIYQTDNGAAGENSFTTSVRNVELIDISGAKTWLDGSGIYGSRPDSLSLTLQRNITGGEKETVDMTPEWNIPSGSDRWTYVYSDLPYADPQGNVYTYTVTETVPEAEGTAGEEGDRYQSSQSGHNLTNTLTGTTGIRGTKVWIDDGEDVRPDSITLTLYRQAGAAGEKEAVTGAEPEWSKDGSEWTYVYEDLPKYDGNGVKYIYSVSEDVPSGYELTEQNDTSLTNTQLTDVSVSKIWGTADGAQIPEYVTVALYRAKDQNGGHMSPVLDGDGNQITMNLTADTGWQGTFRDLLKYDPDTGERYYYGIAEVYVSGGNGETGSLGDYIVKYNGDEANGFVITNITPIEISGTKTWIDGSNASGTRPESIELTLYRSVAGGAEETVDAEAVWTKDGDVWTYVYSNLPMTDDEGNIYTYRVEESQPEAVNGENDTYQMTQNGYDLTNTLTGTTGLTGVKTWIDDGEDVRPDSITLTLYRQAGAAGEKEAVTGAEPEWSKDGSEWTYVYEDLPKYDGNGVKYIYSVSEDVPSGYELTEQNDTSLTNTQLTDVSVSKIWGTADGAQIPEYVTVALYRAKDQNGGHMSPVLDGDGNQITMNLTADTGWQGTFRDLLKYDPDTGERYYYGIAEVYVSGGNGETGSLGDYIVKYNGDEANGFVITNITPIEISGTKTWIDGSNASGTRPESIELTLYRSVAGGAEETVDAEAVWTKDGDVWTYVYSNLPMTDDEGNIYTYRVEESQPEAVNGENDTYQMTQNGYDLTNTLTGTTGIRGTKVWRDNGWTDRGEIVLTLYANGQKYAEDTFRGIGNVWEYSFDDLPKYDENGVLIVYEVREESVPDGYDVKYTEDGIENIQQGTLTVTKTVTGTDGEKDRLFTFTVYLDDQTINGTYDDMTFVNGKARISLRDGDSATAAGLPAYTGYTVVENGADEDGYTVKATGAVGEIQPGATADVSFINHRDTAEDGETPKTGDDSMLPDIALMAAAGAMFTLFLRKRMRSGE